MEFELRADGVLHISGYVNAVERDSRAVVCPECGKCVEQIAAGAFGQALRAAKNVDMLVNHDKGRKVGSTAEGTLRLCEDSIGLRAAAEITDSEVIEKAQRGLLRGWSFGFKARDTDIERRAGNLPRRRVKALDIFEVSIIDDRFSPCYAGTSVEVRAEGEELVETRFNLYHNTTKDDVIEKIGIERDSRADPVDCATVNADYIARYNKAVLDGYRVRAALLDVPPLSEKRFNPYHDDKGRFTTGGNGGGKSSSKGLTKQSATAKIKLYGNARMSKKEKAHVSSEIITNFPNYRSGSVQSHRVGEYVYRFRVNGPGDYHFYNRIKNSPRNQKIINYLEDNTDDDDD